MSVKLPVNNLEIYQTKKGNSITTDTTKLVYMVLEKNKQEKKRVLELGAGNGIISIMLALKREKWEITGVEIQKELLDLAIFNKKLTQTNINFIRADLRDFISSRQKKFDMIITNPPYYAKGQGRISPIRERAWARHELKCKMRDILDVIKTRMTKGGRSYIMYPLSRLKELEDKAKKVDLKITDKKLLKHKNEIKNKFITELRHVKN